MQQQLLSTITQIPDDIARLAHEQQLGAPQANYAVFKFSRGWRWLAFILLPLLCFDLLLIMVSIINVSLISRALNFDVMLPLVLSPFILTYMMSIALLAFVKISNFYVCDKGFIIKQSGKKPRVVRWDEIEAIHSTMIYTPKSVFTRQRMYTLRCHDGYTLTFSASRKRLTNLNKTFEEQLTRRRSPFQFADYQAGQTLSFGPLSINREGIMALGKMLPWEQVADISLLKDRRLVIYKTGERPEVWLNLPAFKIPNLSILLALFKRIRGEQSEQEAASEVLATYGATTTIVSNRRKIDPLPEGLTALAEEHGLGERRVDQHLGRKRLIGWPALIILPGVSILFTGGMLWLFISLVLNMAYDAYWMQVSMAAFLFIAVLFVDGLYLLLFLSALWHFPHAIYTFERGLIFKNGKQAPAVCRWDEIEGVQCVSTFSVRMAYPAVLTSPYAFQRYDGSKLLLSGFDINPQSLTTIIKEQIVPLQLPAAVAAYHDEQTLAFGQLRINQQGIALGERQLPWSQVKSVGLEARQLVIYDITQRRPWCKLRAAQVPDPFLLFALADYARDSTAH
jgi:hypothetical protein